MNLLRKSKEQYKRVLFYTAVIWLLVSSPVFSKEFMMENDWRTAGILLVINAATVGFTFFTFYGIYADSAVSALSTAVYVLSVYRFERYMLERDMAELIFMAVLPLLFYGIYGIEAGKGIRAVLLLGIGGLVTAVLDIGLLEIAVITVIMTAVMAFFLNRNGKALLQIGIAVVVDCAAGGILWLGRMQNPENYSLIQKNGLQLSGLLAEFWKIKSKIPGLEEDALYKYPLGIGLFTLAGMGIFLGLWFLGHISFRNGGEKSVVGAAAVTVCLELCMTLKTFPWDRIQLMNGVTYRVAGALKTPAAFLTPVIFGCALIWGYLLDRNKKKKDSFLYLVCVASVVTAIIASGIYVMDVDNFTVDYYEMLQMQSGLETE